MTFEIWFDFASTYSYLTIARAENRLRHAGMEVDWKPFMLGAIFRAKGWETSPFVLDEVKGAYMWRDVERRAALHGLPFVQPPKFPMHSLLAARVMTAARDEPWRGAFAKDVFTAQFARGEDIADPNVLTNVLRGMTADPAHWLERAQTDAAKSELRAQTETASEIGLFGAPSFRVGDEIFWGDDRFEDAIALAHGTAQALTAPIGSRATSGRFPKQPWDAEAGGDAV